MNHLFLPRAIRRLQGLFACTLFAVVLVMAAASPAYAQDSTLDIAISGDIDNFDPAFNQLILYEALIRTRVFDALTTLDVNMQVAPGLAESWTQVSDTVWEFTLRSGVTFHDGTPLTTEDVIATFERTLDRGLIFASKLDPIETMTAVDDLTLRLELSSPVATFLEDLYSVAITPSEAGEDILSSNPIGTGAFRFESWTPNERIVMQRNDDYWGDLPNISTLVLRVLPDTSTAIANLRAGEVDAVYDVPVSAVQLVEGDDSIEVVGPASSASTFLAELGIHNSEPLQDVRVRRALAHTLDKEAINQIAYFGFGEPVCSPLPSFSWAYAELDCPEYDLEEAQRLLEEAGYGSGLELTVEVIAGSTEMESIATVWQASLAEIGVDLTVRSSEVNIWLDKYINKDYELILNFFNASSDPNSIFDVIYKPLLDVNYDNPEMRAAIDEAVQVTAQDARRPFYEQLQRDTVELAAPLIVIQARPLLTLLSQDVDGWQVNGRNIPFLSDVTLE